jgi:hypothetical protein
MTDYRLHVDMLVPAGETETRFEDLMWEFLQKKAFQSFHDSFDAKLVLALKRPDPFPYTPPNFATVRADAHITSPADRLLSVQPAHDDRRAQDQRGPDAPRAIHYVHLWTVPDLDDLDLAKRMLYCSENSLYMALDSCVMCETQHLVRRVRWQQQPAMTDPSMTFVRVVRQLKYADLGRYLLSLRGLTLELKKRNWHQLGQFQNITGTLNVVTEFWQTKDDSPVSDLLRPSGSGEKPRRSRVQEFAEFVANAPLSVARESFVFAPYLRRTKLTDIRKQREAARHAAETTG